MCPRCCLDSETHNHVLCCRQAQTTWLQRWCMVATTLKSTHKTPSLIYDTLEHGIRSWQGCDPDPQWPFPLPSDNDPIDQAIFLAYTKQSSIGWSQALCGHFCIHWGAVMSTYMQYRELHTTPSNLLNGLGHSSRPYVNTHTANGLTATTPSTEPHSQLPGLHTGSLSRYKSRKHITIAPQFLSTNGPSHLGFPSHYN